MAKAHHKKSQKRRWRSFAVNGSLLLGWRVANGWTQDDAAIKAGLSDRLIRKAESGGPLQIQSIAILAQLYSTPGRRLTPDDLLVEPVTAETARSPSSPPTHPEALVRRFFDELWNQRRYEVIDELLAPDCVLHAEGRELRGRAATRRRAEKLFAAFGEFALDMQDITSHDDLVICRWRLRLTQTGTWNGIPPTGQRMLASGSSWIHVKNGQLTEGWDYWHEPLFGAVVNA